MKKYVTFCLGFTDEKPLVEDKAAFVKLIDGTSLLIPLLMLESDGKEGLDILKDSMHKLVDRFFDNDEMRKLNG